MFLILNYILLSSIVLSAELSFRKNVRNLTEIELKNLKDAYGLMMSIKDNRGYHYLAGFHGWPHFFCWHHQMIRDEHYGIRMFLPWHHAYLYRFEQALKDRNENLSLPWWDWSSDASHGEGMPTAFTNQYDNDNENPLYRTDITYPAEQPTGLFTERDPGLPQELPSKETVDGLMNLSEFSDFLMIPWKTFMMAYMDGLAAVWELLQLRHLIQFSGHITV